MNFVVWISFLLILFTLVSFCVWKVEGHVYWVTSTRYLLALICLGEQHAQKIPTSMAHLSTSLPLHIISDLNQALHVILCYINMRWFADIPLRKKDVYFCLLFFIMQVLENLQKMLSYLSIHLAWNWNIRQVNYFSLKLLYFFLFSSLPTFWMRHLLSLPPLL